MPEIFSSEHMFSYKTYTFGYALYAKRIKNEPLDPVYEKGFLPYTGDAIASKYPLFYMARSARVMLENFTLSSENKRIKKKFSDMQFMVTEKPASEYLKNKTMINFCIEYFEKRHGHGIMTVERIKKLLSYSKEVIVVEYRNAQTETPCAYVIEIHGKHMRHYWFSFFDVALAYSSFGMWLMIDRTEHAKSVAKKFYYLGTVYGDKALYKTNLPALEYWNGQAWTNDIKKLKSRARTDDTRVTFIPDELKEQH